FFRQYVIADREGRILAVHPRSSENPLNREQRWDVRDWFSGLGEQPPHGRRYPPVERPHVSQPYLTRSRSNLSVNVTVPLFGDGVLSGRLLVHDLHAWLDGVDVANGFVILLNERGHCLLHAQTDKIVPSAGANPVDWREACPLYREALSD